MKMSDSEERYNYYYRKGKRHYKENNFQKSLDALKNAYKIKSSETLQTKINKLENLLKTEQEDVTFKPDENKIMIENKFYVNFDLYNKLYNYQKDGVLWLFRLFESRKGGILADDMGLGKTVQVIFFTRELFESDLIKTTLIVMPKSLLINWEREFYKWAPDLTVLMYTGTERQRNLNKIHRRGGILLTTYGTIMNSWDELNIDSKFKWDVIALDEGHKIKNPSSKTFKSVNAIRANMRLVMTGTAVQNKLKELWALFDFTHQGTLLGSYTTFAIEYERPLTQSRNKDASETEKLYGDEIAASLKAIIKPFFLRRTKEEVTSIKDSGEIISAPNLMRKNDLIVWIQMTDAQIEIYQKFLQLDEIKQLLTMTEKRSPLLELNILKKICDHPRLLKADHCAEMGLTFANSIDDVEIKMLQGESGKMEFLLRLVKQLVGENHKCLVFSQSKVVLNIIERLLKNNGVINLRLDGDILKPIDRQNIVDSFNNDPSFQVLLLTSQVGGVGLTLTGADRAIIYDLSWNPSIDAQAVDRVYRIGQLKNVVVYRLITCGTVEEKIYRRQIFKDSVNRQTTGIQKTDNNPFRYFTQGELLELFTLDNPRVSNTQIQLEEMHSKFRKSDVSLDEHVLWLTDQNIFGITDHDLMFSQEEANVVVDDETRFRLIDNRKQAESRVVKEAKLVENDEEGELRHLMTKMSLTERKQKVKEIVNPQDLFIPSKADIKRPGYNVLLPPPQRPNLVQTVLTKPTVDNPFLQVKGKGERPTNDLYSKVPYHSPVRISNNNLAFKNRREMQETSKINLEGSTDYVLKPENVNDVQVISDEGDYDVYKRSVIVISDSDREDAYEQVKSRDEGELVEGSDIEYTESDSDHDEVNRDSSDDNENNSEVDVPVRRNFISEDELNGKSEGDENDESDEARLSVRRNLISDDELNKVRDNGESESDENDESSEVRLSVQRDFIHGEGKEITVDCKSSNDEEDYINDVIAGLGSINASHPSECNPVLEINDQNEIIDESDYENDIIDESF